MVGHNTHPLRVSTETALGVCAYTQMYILYELHHKTTFIYAMERNEKQLKFLHEQCYYDYALTASLFRFRS